MALALNNLKIVDMPLNKETNQNQGIIGNLLHCSLQVNEFELQSHFYVQFQSNTQGKAMNFHTQLQ